MRRSVPRIQSSRMHSHTPTLVWRCLLLIGDRQAIQASRMHAHYPLLCATNLTLGSTLICNWHGPVPWSNRWLERPARTVDQSIRAGVKKHLPRRPGRGKIAKPRRNGTTPKERGQPQPSNPTPDNIPPWASLLQDSIQNEAAFLYDLNRLNVAVTRARCKARHWPLPTSKHIARRTHYLIYYTGARYNMCRQQVPKGME